MLKGRLLKISSIVNDHSKVIWDVCCDHGLLGEYFLKKNKSVYFIDQVKNIIEKLNERISKRYSKTSFACLATSGENIEIVNSKDESIIIAGVGGETCIKILKKIIAKHKFIKSQIILSPQKNLDKVRTFLLEENIHEISHDIVYDKNQLYNILNCKMEL